jgi:hypothetical protein
MAYYIFPKSLNFLEEFRKNPHIKIATKSPCTISKAFVNSKKSYFILKGISPSFQPNRPSSQPAHSAQPASFLLLPHRSSARKPLLPVGLEPPLTTSADRKKLSRHPSLISPLYDALPLQSSSNWHLQSRSIEAPSTPAIEGTRPPQPHLRPIKGHPSSMKIPTPPTLLLLGPTAPTPPPF